MKPNDRRVEAWSPSPSIIKNDFDAAIRDGHICFSGVSRNKKEKIVCVWISLYGLNPVLALLEAGFLKATF